MRCLILSVCFGVMLLPMVVSFRPSQQTSPFSTDCRRRQGGSFRRNPLVGSFLQQSSDETVSPVASSSSTQVEDLIQEDTEILELSLKDHRPLGCTVEESLGKRYGNVVFCTKVTPGGFAEKAGVQIGDVFLAVSGMFGALEDVTGAGIERVKSLVAACPDDEPLLLRLARGTPVLDDHEEAVVELCSNPDKMDSEVDECVTDFLRAGYYTEDDADSETDDSTASKDDDDDNLLDNMFNMWAEDLPPPSTPTDATDADDSSQKAKAKPWSSRSSPSGTFVRDPRTGKMKNIDA